MSHRLPIPQRKPPRQGQQGFSLFETLVAFAILAMVLTVSLSVFANSASRQSGRLHALHAAEFALSVSEEYRLTAPAMAEQGQAANGWAWRMAQTPVAPDGRTELTPLMDLIELEITVFHVNRSADVHRFTTIVARRRS